jgi:4-hydroxy-L-threonine phosphate dehydrogenase PdxA
MSSPRASAAPKSAGPKSSPKRTAQDALNRAAKAASRPRAAETPKQNSKRTSMEAKQLAAAIVRGIADGQLDVVAADALQALLAAACKLYTARREAGEDFAPVAKNSISATDVMVTASALLRAADLAAFELGMWQGWTGR